MSLISVARGVLVGGFCLLTASCDQFGLPFGGGGESEGDGEEADPKDGKPDRGFTAEPGSCNAWKISYCNAIEECDAFSSHEECQIDVGYVRCLDSAPVAKCADEIDRALEKKKCGELPSECTPQKVADRTVPTQLCEEIYRAMCDFNVFCGLEISVESCIAAMNVGAPCTEFTAAWPGAEVCPDLIDQMGCRAQIPSECVGVLRY